MANGSGPIGRIAVRLSRRLMVAAWVSRGIIAAYVIVGMVFIEIGFAEQGVAYPWRIVAVTPVVFILGIPIYALISSGRNDRRMKKMNAELSQKVTRLTDLVSEMTAGARQEVATWLHGTAQGKLLHVALVIGAEIDACRVLLEAKATEAETPDERRRVVAQALEELQEKVGLKLEHFNDEVLRARAHELFPPALTIGLDFALRQLLAGRARYSIDQRLTTAATVRQLADDDGGEQTREHLRATLADRVVLGREMKYAIYRCVEEGVNNAVKRHAKDISVTVDVAEDWIVCRVSNDGDPLPAKFDSGLGLVTIDTLVSDLRGEWTLTTVDYRTVLKLKFPKPQMTASSFFQQVEMNGA